MFGLFLPFECLAYTHVFTLTYISMWQCDWQVKETFIADAERSFLQEKMALNKEIEALKSRKKGARKISPPRRDHVHGYGLVCIYESDIRVMKRALAKSVTVDEC